VHITVIHIGSNVGKREKYLYACKVMLEETVGRITKSSMIYKTEAWGKKDQNEFLNQAFQIETQLGLEDLLAACQRIEARLERDRSIRWGPRTIDLDIIFYDRVSIDRNHLCVPHPRMHLRNFVLYPVAEIVPEYIHPVLLQTVLELKEASKDLSHVSV